jgi:chromosome segregation ATPase
MENKPLAQSLETLKGFLENRILDNKRLNDENCALQMKIASLLATLQEKDSTLQSVSDALHHANDKVIFLQEELQRLREGQHKHQHQHQQQMAPMGSSSSSIAAAAVVSNSTAVPSLPALISPRSSNGNAGGSLSSSASSAISPRDSNTATGVTPTTSERYVRIGRDRRG